MINLRRPTRGDVKWLGGFFLSMILVTIAAAFLAYLAWGFWQSPMFFKTHFGAYFAGVLTVILVVGWDQA